MLSNFTLLLAYFIFLGKNNFIKTIYGSWIYSIFIKLTEEISTITDTPLLAAIFCGIICSFDLGLVFLGNSSTGGPDIITQILHRYTPLPLAVAMTIVDGFSLAKD